MAKKEELKYNETPKFLYQLTQNFMYDYVENLGTPDDQIWFAELGLKHQKPIERAGKKFEVLDIQEVRKAFAKRFFPELDPDNKVKVSSKKTYKEKLEEMLAKAKAAKEAAEK